MTCFIDNDPLGSALKQVTSKHGSRAVLQYNGRAVTYTQFAELIEEKTISYRSVGISHSSIVGTVADDPLEFLSDVFALISLGVFVLLLPSESTAWEQERIANMVGHSCILSSQPRGADCIPVAADRFLTRFEESHAAEVRCPAIGFLTSGTTGLSKIAVRSPSAILLEATAVQARLRLSPGKRFATLVPLHHSFGFGDCAVAAILAGAQLCVYPRMPPSGYLEYFERLPVDLVALVPAQLRLLAEACKAPTFPPISVISAGSPLDRRTAALVSERLHWSLGQVYGTTETGAISIAGGDEDASSVGIPLEIAELRLDPVPADWRSVDAAETDTAEGIIAIRSKALFQGYLTRNGLDQTAVLSGWFSTGDRARLVAGHLQLLGRLTSAINVAGMKVSPEEIEAAIHEFPSIRSVLVTGVDDVLSYQRIKAYVTPADVDIQALRKFCEERLSMSKRPHYYEAVTALATTASGKVLRAGPPK